MRFSGLKANTVKLILGLAERIIEFIIKNEEGQKGGVLCVGTPENGLPLLICVFGQLTEQEIRDCTNLAQEKAARLAKNIGDWTSWQSRDMNTSPKRYGGAIQTEDFILSFSGFREEQDEAAMLVLATSIGTLPGGAAAILAQLSKNLYFRRLQNALSNESHNPLDRFQFSDEKHP